MLVQNLLWVAALVLGISGLLASATAAAASPATAGLVLWVDATNVDSAKADAQGRLAEWRDLSGKGNHLYASGEASSRPQLVADGMNGKPVVRFSGGQSLAMQKAVRSQARSGAVLIVWQRSAAQATGDKWQRIISSRTDTTKGDGTVPNFSVTGTRDGEPKPCEPAIYDLELTDMPIGALVVGRTSEGNWQYLKGDVAEILVYDKSFLSEGEIQEAFAYLKTKWNARVDREESGWTRTGDLGPVPRHTRQDLPLSDQGNRGQWTLDPKFTDEFTTDSIDMKRWHLNPTSPGDWVGREPAMFYPQNVTQKDGMLHLAFKKGDVPEMQKHKGYKDYTSCLIQSNDLTGYGYYEIRARPMNSAGSSSFWFTETRLNDNATEIDVFEIGGKAPGFERKYNMNGHVWKTPTETRHWAAGGVWNSPFRFADDFHVYGFEWNKQELIWYVDGVPVRKAANTNWFFPMRVIFDSEAMWSWFGKVNDADLPSTFSVDYLRVWRQAAR